MAKVLVSRDAERDLVEIDDYLTSEAGDGTAKAYAGRFAATLRRLASWPASGPPRPALGTATRIAVVWPFVIIYDHDTAADEVVVLRVLHGRQRITARLLGR